MMTRDTALSLLKQYGAYLRATRQAAFIATGHPPITGLLTDPIVYEADLRFPADGNEKKAMRWLGFVQGA